MNKPEEEERERIPDSDSERDGTNRAGETTSSNRRGGKLYKFERDMVAGAVMGGAVHTVVAPIERVKLLLQTQEGNAALLSASGSGVHRKRFKGFVDCVGRTVREEGFISLWRGNGTGVLRYYPSVALNFSLKVQPFLSFLVLFLDFFLLGKSSVNAIRLSALVYRPPFKEILLRKMSNLVYIVLPILLYLFLLSYCEIL